MGRKTICFVKASFKDFENIPGIARTTDQLYKALNTVEYVNRKLHISL